MEEIIGASSGSLLGSSNAVEDVIDLGVPFSELQKAAYLVDQEPDWCSSDFREWQCRTQDKYLLSGLKYLPPTIPIVIEFLCILPLALSLLLQRYFKNLTFWQDRSIYIKVGLVATTMLHMVATFGELSWMFLYQSKKVGMYLCILIPIFFSSSLRGCFSMTLRIGHSIIDTAGLLAAFIVSSAWLANVLFSDPNFEDFSTSLLNLFVMLTTANNPNVWANIYEENRVTFFFFFSYMIIGFFFLMHLVFALIYNNYKVQLAVAVKKHTTTRQITLRAAFDLLNLQRDGITVTIAHALFFEIGSYRQLHDVSTIIREILDSLNYKGGEKIIFGDFQLLCRRFVKAIEAEAHERYPAYDSKKLELSWLEGFVDSGGYTWLSFAATFASMVVALLDQNIRNSDSSDVSPPGLSKFIPSLDLVTKCEFVFGWFFLAELTLKLLVGGIRMYLSSILECFDFVTTLVIICLQLSTIWYKEAYNWIPVLMVLRSLRAVTLLKYFKRWRLMGSLLIRMIPATAPILGFQFCVCLLFSVAGVQLFGGLVYVGNPRLEGTEYADSGLWVYNYNDLGAAMVTSFNLCVVNNWFVIMDGYAAATRSAWSRAYFVIFWAVAVTFTLNVVVAFFVGAFTTQMEKAEHALSMSLLASPRASRSSVLTRRKLGTNVLMDLSGTLSKYEIYEEVVGR